MIKARLVKARDAVRELRMDRAALEVPEQLGERIGTTPAPAPTPAPTSPKSKLVFPTTDEMIVSAYS